MYDFLKQFDGTGREPRLQQRQALEWISKHWTDARVLAISAPVATGKSSISRAIQLRTGAPIITAQNLLIDQYMADYPTVNFLKGKGNYQCHNGVSCYDWQNLCQMSPCEDCPYQKCKAAAISRAPTFFNPLSYFYATKNKLWKSPAVMVIDEAHKLKQTIASMCGVRLPKSKYPFTSQCCNEIYLSQWLGEQIARLGKLRKLYLDGKDVAKLETINEEIQRLSFIKQGVEEDAQNYAIWISTEKFYKVKTDILNIVPIKPPKFITRRILDANKIIMLSGTILPADIEEVIDGMSYKYVDLPSPIPKERRPIYYAPVPFKMNFETDPSKIVAAIEAVIKRNAGVNTMVHLTYSMAKKCKPFWTLPVISNDSNDDKMEKLETFKQKGGIFIACGLAEGVDLKGDLCRLNIIPKLPFPDMTDHAIKKRMALADGEEWYNMQALKNVIQMCGRSTRDVNDYSKTYILDPQFGWRANKYRNKLPKSFMEAIIWTKE